MKHLPNELWGEFVSTATYIMNRCTIKKLNNITPEDCWSGDRMELDEVKEWNWNNNEMKNTIRLMCEDSSRSDESTTQSETRRPQIHRSMPTRLQDCKVTHTR